MYALDDCVVVMVVVLYDKFTQLPVNSCLTSLYLYLKKTYWRPEDRWLCGGDCCGVMRYVYPVANVFVFDLTVFLFKKTYWRPEDRWLCGGDGLGVMRYGYPGLPPTLTPGRKRDTITSVKSEQQTREIKHCQRHYGPRR